MAVLFTHEASDETEKTNSTSTFSEHLTTTFTAVGSRQYLIQLYCEVRMAANTTYAEIKLELDNTTTLCLPSDTNLFYTDPWIPVTAMYRGTFTAGTRQLDVDFRNFNNTTTITLRRVRLMIIEETT